ncbi:UDP-glucoronosyl and UDP-glucosyl transferase, partial [Ostertagia ostertagi]
MYFVERTINLIASIFADICSSDFGRRYKEVWSRHGAAADEEYYKRRTNYLLSNTDEFLEFGRPSSPKIVHIGGIALPEAAPLSEKLQQIVDHVNMGVVYISFGSVAPTNEMPKYFREAIIEVAKVFSNYDFIWKVDEGDAVQNISNLHTFSWVTQAALIAHPRLRCFVSHGGLNSVLEVTRSGKPSIMVPIYGDQMRNARLVEVKNTTIVIAKEDFNRVTFAAALEQVLSDKSYSQRAERLASLMVNKPFPVRDRLLSTVEFSIRHGRISDLDIGTHLNTLQYYSIDVMIFLIIFFSFVATTFMYVLRYLFRKTVKVKVQWYRPRMQNMSSSRANSSCKQYGEAPRLEPGHHIGIDKFHAVEMKTILLYLSLSFFSVNAYKILIYSAPLGYSHTIFMGRIADILQEAGHNV